MPTDWYDSTHRLAYDRMPWSLFSDFVIFSRIAVVNFDLLMMRRQLYLCCRSWVIHLGLGWVLSFTLGMNGGIASIIQFLVSIHEIIVGTLKVLYGVAVYILWYGFWKGWGRGTIPRVIRKWSEWWGIRSFEVTETTKTCSSLFGQGWECCPFCGFVSWQAAIEI